MKYTFRTDDTALVHRNGQHIVIIETVTKPNKDFDEEALPVHLVTFPDSHQEYVWFDEVITRATA